MREDVEWLEAEAEGEWIIESDGESADERYAALRPALGESWRNAPPEQIEALLQEATRGMTIAEAENFWQSLANFGRQIAPIAAPIISTAAPIIGTAFGGPLGAALGGAVGQAAGQALGSLGRPPAAPAPAAGPRPAAPGMPPPAAPAGSPATGQLLALLQNPQLMQSMLGQLLGAAGRSTQPVGPAGAQAPFGAFMNALSVLANQAAAESQSDAESSYLYDSHGHLLGDPSSPEDRAAVLLQQLRARPVPYA